MQLICDLHVHTNASADGHCPVEKVLERTKAAGLDAVAVTDHDTTVSALKALSLESEVIVIPGIEVSTKDGHVLILGTTKEYEAGKPADETIAEAQADGCVTVIPHPYHLFRHATGLRNKKALKMADAFEVYNSRYYIGVSNLEAKHAAKRLGK
ncbi:MAG TPA: PHP domain-containing protein, partial [Methanocorpusculum sp.]|nr:PHP domain-containing protein [Methanocorpusculum sp.]